MATTKSPRLRLLHIRDEIDGVTVAMRGVTFVEYQRSYTLRRTVERALQIISEATRALPKAYLSRYPEAPWTAIAGIGNILRHEYQHIDDRRLWDVATVHLPQLRPTILRMLAELDE